MKNIKDVNYFIVAELRENKDGDEVMGEPIDLFDNFEEAAESALLNSDSLHHFDHVCVFEITGLSVRLSIKTFEKD